MNMLLYLLIFFAEILLLPSKQPLYGVHDDRDVLLLRPPAEDDHGGGGGQEGGAAAAAGAAQGGQAGGHWECRCSAAYTCTLLSLVDIYQESTKIYHHLLIINVTR